MRKGAQQKKKIWRNEGKSNAGGRKSTTTREHKEQKNCGMERRLGRTRKSMSEREREEFAGHECRTLGVISTQEK